MIAKCQIKQVNLSSIFNSIVKNQIKYLRLKLCTYWIIIIHQSHFKHLPLCLTPTVRQFMAIGYIHLYTNTMQSVSVTWLVWIRDVILMSSKRLQSFFSLCEKLTCIYCNLPSICWSFYRFAKFWNLIMQNCKQNPNPVDWFQIKYLYSILNCHKSLNRHLAMYLCTSSDWHGTVYLSFYYFCKAPLKPRP